MTTETTRETEQTWRRFLAGYVPPPVPMVSRLSNEHAREAATRIRHLGYDVTVECLMAGVSYLEVRLPAHIARRRPLVTTLRTWDDTLAFFQHAAKMRQPPSRKTTRHAQTAGRTAHDENGSMTRGTREALTTTRQDG